MNSKNTNPDSNGGDWLTNHWPWLIVGFLLIYPVLFTIENWGDNGFQSGMIGNLIATLIGVATGIPVAAQFERWRQSKEEAKSRREQTNRAKVIADAILFELRMNAKYLAKVALGADPGNLFVSVGSDEVWRAVSNSAEIRWLDDPKLLSDIALAYFFWGVVKTMNDDVNAITRGNNPTYAKGSDEHTQRIADLKGYIPGVVERIKKTSDEIANIYELPK